MMEPLTILDSSHRSDYSDWLSIWSEWPDREVFAHPDYVNLYVRKDDRAVCAVQKNSAGLILLPMVLRPLAVEPWAGMENEFYDLVAPYGYGGPYFSGEPDLTEFWRNFQQWAIAQNIISAFFRFSPFAADITGLIDSVDSSGGNVIRSLAEGQEGIWKDYKHAVRTCVRFAEMNDVTVIFDERGERLPTFIQLYYQTMNRCHAAPQYYFPQEFFQRIVRNLQGQFFFSFAVYQGQEIAGKLVLNSREHIYPFLGGADERYFHLYPNQLLDTRIFFWGVEHGKKSCVLGGGYNGYDGVFQYKKKFAPAGVVPFSVGKHIFNLQAYEKMCEKRKRYEVQQGRICAEEGSYFPAYRTKND